MPPDPTPPAPRPVVYDALGRPLIAWDPPVPVARFTVYDRDGSVIRTGVTYAPDHHGPPESPDDGPPDEPHVVG